MTTESQKEFAVRLGVADSYVTKLKQHGRLVMEGKRVNVEASIAKIEATRDPSHESKVVKTTPAENASAPDEKTEATEKGMSYASARAVKERYAALLQKLEYERQVGNLIPRDEVEAAFSFIGAAVRAALDVFPDQVSPLVAPVTDLADVHALLAEQCRNVLVKLGETTDRQRAALAAVGKGDQ